MGSADRIVRGILIGGALGAFAALLGYTDSMFYAVGIGAVAGLLAGLTRAAFDNKKTKK